MPGRGNGINPDAILGVFDSALLRQTVNRIFGGNIIGNAYKIVEVFI